MALWYRNQIGGDEFLEDFQWEGEWWLPGNETNRVKGKLAFSNSEGLQLCVYSMVEGLDRKFPVVHSIILGESSDGLAITLHQCESDWPTLFDPTMAGTRYNAQVAYVGSHLADPENATFYRLQVRYTYLSDWAMNRHQLKRSETDSGEFFYWVRLDDVAVDVADARISITYVADEFEKALADPLKPPPPDCTVLTVTSRSGQTLDGFLREYVNPLRDLVSFGESKASDILELRLHQTNAGDRINGRLGTLVLFRQLERGHDWRNPPGSATKLFGLPDVLPLLTETLMKWFLMRRSLRIALQPYFAEMYLNQGFLEHRFLTMVSALEAYHRIALSGENKRVMKDEEYQDWLRIAADAAPPRYREWVLKKFENSNEPTLGRRLKDVIGVLRETADSDEAPKWPPSISKAGSFLCKVVQTGNYLVHGLEEMREKAAQGEELHLLLLNLELLLRGLMLHDLGLLTTQRRKQLGHKWFGAL